MPLPRGVGWPDHRSEKIAAQSTHGHHSALSETWRCSEIIFHPPIEANPDAPVGKCFVCVEIFNLLHLTHTQIGLNVWDFERDLDVVLLKHYTTFHWSGQRLGKLDEVDDSAEWSSSKHNGCRGLPWVMMRMMMMMVDGSGEKDLFSHHYNPDHHYFQQHRHIFLGGA